MTNQPAAVQVPDGAEDMALQDLSGQDLVAQGLAAQGLVVPDRTGKATAGEQVAKRLSGPDARTGNSKGSSLRVLPAVITVPPQSLSPSTPQWQRR